MWIRCAWGLSEMFMLLTNAAPDAVLDALISGFWNRRPRC